jgi:hypothetical protein
VGKTAVTIDLTDSERRELESFGSRRKTAQGLAQRARIVLLAAEDAEKKDISLRVNAAPPHGRQVAKALCRASSCGYVGRATSWRAAADRR